MSQRTWLSCWEVQSLFIVKQMDILNPKLLGFVVKVRDLSHLRGLLKVIFKYFLGKLSKDFIQLSLRNNTLIVDYATSSDEGFYMCQATNNIGNGLKKVIHINVNGWSI